MQSSVPAHVAAMPAMRQKVTKNCMQMSTGIQTSLMLILIFEFQGFRFTAVEPFVERQDTDVILTPPPISIFITHTS